MTNFEDRFSGARLREAREARAIPGVTLAERVGVTPTSISQYEHSKQVPSPPILARLSTILNMPQHFFLQRDPRIREPNLRWRSQSSAKQLHKKRATHRFKWICRISNLCERFLSFPKPNVPDFGFTSDPAALEDVEIDRVAQEVRRKWNLGDGPISDVVRLAENNGVVVIRNELGEHLDAFSDWDYLGSQRLFIVLGTDKLSAVRSRFNVGHELAHAVLHKNVPVAVAKCKETHKLMEHQANRFAAAFHMPAETFASEVYSLTLDSLLSIKKRWRVSVQAMIMRLFHLGEIDEQKMHGLFIQVSRRRWRKREPLDNELKPEEPNLLRRAIDTLLERHLVDKEQITMHIGIHPSDVEKTLGLADGYLGIDTHEPLNFPFLSIDESSAESN